MLLTDITFVSEHRSMSTKNVLQLEIHRKNTRVFSKNRYWLEPVSILHDILHSITVYQSDATRKHYKLNHKHLRAILLFVLSSTNTAIRSIHKRTVSACPSHCLCFELLLNVTVTNYQRVGVHGDKHGVQYGGQDGGQIWLSI